MSDKPEEEKRKLLPIKTTINAEYAQALQWSAIGIGLIFSGALVLPGFLPAIGATSAAVGRILSGAMPALSSTIPSMINTTDGLALVEKGFSLKDPSMHNILITYSNSYRAAAFIAQWLTAAVTLTLNYKYLDYNEDSNIPSQAPWVASGLTSIVLSQTSNNLMTRSFSAGFAWSSVIMLSVHVYRSWGETFYEYNEYFK